MIVDLFDKLIDRCIQLETYRKESKERYFANFVEPVYMSIEELHRDYLNSFERYRGWLIKAPDNLEQIINEMKSDNLFSGDKRRKVVSQLSSLFDEDDLDADLKTFIAGIFSYMDYCTDYIPGEDPRKWSRTQLLRQSLIQKLSSYVRNDFEFKVLGQNNKIHLDELIEVLDNSIRDIQYLNGIVSDRFLILKKSWLK